MPVMELFSTLVEESKDRDALLVGKNMMNNDPANTNVFRAYFDYLCRLASHPITLDERRLYATEADTVLAFFAESVSMSADALKLIELCRRRLESIIVDIIKTEESTAQKALADIRRKNADELGRLASLKSRLHTAKRKRDFDSLLRDVQKSETSIEKDYLSEKEQDLYETLTADYSKIVNEKLLEFERAENVVYNKAAVESMKKVFDRFLADESSYKKSRTQLYALVAQDLFGFDASKLFNETLIYYNHVYSFIFSKLDDEGKFRLTQFAIDCEKSRK